MEPRAAAAEYDKGTGNYTLWSTSQNPHVLRLILSAFVLGIPEHKVRVIAPDVGGGFGSKIFIYPEETVCVWASNKVGRPVRCRLFQVQYRRNPRRCHARTVAGCTTWSAERQPRQRHRHSPRTSCRSSSDPARAVIVPARRRRCRC